MEILHSKYSQYSIFGQPVGRLTTREGDDGHDHQGDVPALLGAVVWEAGSQKSTCDSGHFEIQDSVFPYPV